MWVLEKLIPTFKHLQAGQNIEAAMDEKESKSSPRDQDQCYAANTVSANPAAKLQLAQCTSNVKEEPMLNTDTISRTKTSEAIQEIVRNYGRHACKVCRRSNHTTDKCEYNPISACFNPGRKPGKRISEFIERKFPGVKLIISKKGGRKPIKPEVSCICGFSEQKVEGELNHAQTEVKESVGVEVGSESKTGKQEVKQTVRQDVQNDVKGGVQTDGALKNMCCVDADIMERDLKDQKAVDDCNMISRLDSCNEEGKELSQPESAALDKLMLGKQSCDDGAWATF